MKYCRKCGEHKPLSLFNKRAASKDGLQSYCKPCHRVLARKSRALTHGEECGCTGCISRLNASSESSLWCPKCRRLKPLGEFVKASSTRRGYAAYCKGCFPRTDAKVAREAHRARAYGLSPQDVDAMLATRAGKCICGDLIDEANLHVDHDHSCCEGAKSCGRCVRGLLCGDCNRALGLIRDSPDRAMALAAYLLTFQNVPRGRGYGA